MPKPNFSDITLVLDRSGSMESIASDTVGGVARFIEDQKKAPGTADLTLTLFDHEYTPVHKAVPLASVPPFTDKDFVPRGNTALLDAVGRSIVETGERIAALPEGDRPAAVVFVIVTDGLENSSREYSRAKVAEMIKHQQEVYSWTFLFLAANQDAIAAAGAINIPAAQAMSYAPTSDGIKGMFFASAGVVRSARSGTRGAGYSDEDRAKQKKQGAV